MIKKDDILKLSNTKLRRLKKGELVDAVLTLKSELNDALSANNSTVLQVESHELNEEVVKLRSQNEALRSKVSELHRNVKQLYKTISLNKKVIKANNIDCSIKIKELKSLKERGLWRRLLNIS